MMACPECGSPNSRFVKARARKTEDGDTCPTSSDAVSAVAAAIVLTHLSVTRSPTRKPSSRPGPPFCL